MGRRRNPVNLKSNTMISKTNARNERLKIVNLHYFLQSEG